MNAGVTARPIERQRGHNPPEGAKQGSIDNSSKGKGTVTGQRQPARPTQVRYIVAVAVTVTVTTTPFDKFASSRITRASKARSEQARLISLAISHDCSHFTYCPR